MHARATALSVYPCKGLETTYAIIEIDEIHGIAGKGHSGGYLVVAGKHKLRCTEHRDRQLNTTSRVNVVVQGQSCASCRRDRVGRLCFLSLTLMRL